MRVPAASRSKDDSNDKQGMNLAPVAFISLLDRVQKRAHQEFGEVADISIFISKKEAPLRLLRGKAIHLFHQSTAAASTG